MTRSGSSEASRVSSIAQAPRPASMAARTFSSISRSESPAGSKSQETTFGRRKALGGKSHSWLTPTSESSSPSRQTISVALGSSETIRTSLRSGSGRGRLQPRKTALRPGKSTEENSRVEEVARQCRTEKRNGRDIAGDQARKRPRVELAGGPDGEVRRQVEERGRSERGAGDGQDRRSSCPKQKPDADDRRECSIDDGHPGSEPPAGQELQHGVADEHRRQGHGKRPTLALEMRAGKEGDRGHRREVGRMRQEPQGRGAEDKARHQPESRFAVASVRHDSPFSRTRTLDSMPGCSRGYPP